MKFDDIYVAVISHKRPDNVKKMEKITGLTEELHWFVGTDEAQDYECCATGCVIEGGDLCHSRNMALEAAFAENKYCLMLCDDLTKCTMLTSMKQPNDVSFATMIGEMYDVLKSVPLYLAGIAPTNNPFFYNPVKPLGLKHFCVGDLTLTKPNPLRFDTALRTKEDYDITLQHVQKYGGVCRINYIAPTFLHYKNEGGVVDYRTDEIEQASIRHLKSKWGKSIRDNSRRPNEILLRL